jgi:hypothetical protein
MLECDTRYKIVVIVSRNVVAGEADYCTAIRNMLCRWFTTRRVIKNVIELAPMKASVAELDVSDVVLIADK